MSTQRVLRRRCRRKRPSFQAVMSTSCSRERAKAWKLTTRRRRLAARGGVAAGRSDGKPKGVAAETSQETASFRGGYGGIALAGERCELEGVIGGVLFRGGEPGLAGTAVLNIVVERLEVSGGDLGGTAVFGVRAVRWDGGRPEDSRCGRKSPPLMGRRSISLGASNSSAWLIRAPVLSFDERW
jgi:hypothetical protein